jgi:hypothetical protein
MTHATMSNACRHEASLELTHLACRTAEQGRSWIAHLCEGALNAALC